MEAHNLSELNSIENKSFWQKHYEQFKSSNLARTIYCEQNNLNYERFGYWIKRQNLKNNNKFVSVKLKSNINSITPATVLCTLDLKNGRNLKIVNEKALCLILEKYF